MAKSERPTTGKYANYEHVADRVDGVHRVNEDRVEIKTSKPTFETHELLGSLIVCEATVTIYPTDPLLPDKVEYIQQAHKTIAKPDGKSGFKSLEMNSDSMYETVQTKAIGRALAAAGYLGRKCSEKMSFEAAEDIQDAKEATSSTTTSQISDDQMCYCRQRGLDPEESVSLIVNGFCKEVLKELPMEFAVEAQKLLSVSLEGSVG